MENIVEKTSQHTGKLQSLFLHLVRDIHQASMRIEIPEFGRCCVCVPLRHGILTFGYLNLSFTILLIALEIYVTIMYDYDYTAGELLGSSSIYMYRGVGLYSQMWFVLLIYSFEVIFNVLLLVGGHMKRPSLIRAYYYYGITTSLAAFASYLLVGNDPSSWRTLDHHIFEFCFAFAGFVLHVYLLLLIRSELKKLDKESQLCFVNHSAEVYVNAPRNQEGRNPL